MPSRSRPIKAKLFPPRLCCCAGVSTSSDQTSASVAKPKPGGRSPAPGKRNQGGSTPRIVAGSPFSEITRPTISESPPNRRRHNPSARSRSRVSPLSSGVKTRPIFAETPSVWKKSPLTRTALMRSGSPVPVRFTRSARTHARCSKVVLRARKSKTSPGEEGSRSNPVRCWTSALNSHGITRRSLRGYGRGRSSTRSIRLKMAALPPIASASVAIATAAKEGRRASARKAARISDMGFDVRVRGSDVSIARHGTSGGFCMMKGPRAAVGRTCAVRAHARTRVRA
jgi:hypothetical protein